MNTPLRQAFEKARETGEIEHVYDPLLAAQLFVICSTIEEGQVPPLFLAPSPRSDRLSVTVSERAEWLATGPSITLVETTGAELFDGPLRRFELVVVHDDGGDYLSREDIDWLRPGEDDA